MVHIVIYHGGNNGQIDRRLKYCIQNFKISLKISKYKIDMLYILKKANLKAERKAHSTGYFCFTQKI